MGSAGQCTRWTRTRCTSVDSATTVSARVSVRGQARDVSLRLAMPHALIETVGTITVRTSTTETNMCDRSPNIEKRRNLRALVTRSVSELKKRK